MSDSHPRSGLLLLRRRLGPLSILCDNLDRSVYLSLWPSQKYWRGCQDSRKHWWWRWWWWWWDYNEFLFVDTFLSHLPIMGIGEIVLWQWKPEILRWLWRERKREIRWQWHHERTNLLFLVSCCILIPILISRLFDSWLTSHNSSPLDATLPHFTHNISELVTREILLER